MNLIIIIGFQNLIISSFWILTIHESLTVSESLTVFESLTASDSLTVQSSQS